MLCPSNLVQLAIGDYLQNQPWLEQVKVFREIYLERRDTLLEAMKIHFPLGTTWTEPKGGFYSWVTLPEGFDATAMLPRAVNALVAYVPGTGFYANKTGERNLRLSFCYPEPSRIQEGVRRLGEVIRQEIELRDTFGVTGKLTTQTGDLSAPDVV
jgi:DNA-binding transcriptional MocR family regulator